MDRTKTLASLIALLFCASCGGPKKIVVGSKNFTESVLLGEIVAQHIERRLHVTVDRKLNLGGTLLAHQALISGGIDLYPEYTGTALTAVLKRQPVSDAAKVLEQVRAGYAMYGLVWLPPLGFNNTFAMVVRSADASYGTMSKAAQSRTWRLGVGYEFLQRPDGLPGLVKAYSLKGEGAPVSMDLGLLYSALQSNKVDMVAASSTDGMLSVLDVKTLQDDRHYFPPYECAVVARNESLGRHPQLGEALKELSGKLNDQTMQKLNYAVDGKHRQVKDVAAEFLQSSFSGSI
ncbi:MAG: glycine betaine ABC transporter substrate-binding protein [Bryobacteraceae bacterium]